MIGTFAWCGQVTRSPGRGLTRSNFSKLRFFFARTTSSIYQLAEQWLADEDARPRIAVRGHFTTAPEIVRHSDLAAIFPRLLALDLYRARDFRLLDLPFELPPMEIKCIVTHALPTTPASSGCVRRPQPCWARPPMACTRKWIGDKYPAIVISRLARSYQNGLDRTNSQIFWRER